MCFCSVERMVDYVQHYQPEAPAIVPHKPLPPEWPSQGDITVHKLVVRYRTDLPDVLK